MEHWRSWSSIIKRNSQPDTGTARAARFFQATFALRVQSNSPPVNFK